MKKQKLHLKKLKVTSFKTSDIDGAKLQGGAVSGPYCNPTPDTRCFICVPDKTLDHICDPTAATFCFVCPPFTQDIQCEKTQNYVC